jgi:hypothetical protein
LNVGEVEGRRSSALSCRERVIAVNLARGHAKDCGCFDVHAAGKSREELLADVRLVILRDTAILLMVGQILAASRRPAHPPG